MDFPAILNLIRTTASPLKRQLLTAALITNRLEGRGKSAPVVIGGAALSYYSREVYLTADLDLAYADREALDAVLLEIGFAREGRYWVSRDLGMAVEAPASALVGEDAPVERVEFEGGLFCRVLGLEDLVVDRLNACKHWKSKNPGEAAAVRERVRRFEEVSPIEFLALRERLGFGRYVKVAPRDPDKAAILRDLAWDRMDRAEKGDYIPLAPHRRLLVL